MAKGRVSMQKLRELLRLKQQCGQSNRAIASALGISHTAVRRHLEICADRGITFAAVAEIPDSDMLSLLETGRRAEDPRLAMLHDNMAHYARELTRVGVTRQLLWQEYKHANPDGYGYSQFCLHFQQWLDAQKLEMHVDHKAGDKMFVDYAGEKMHYVDPLTGEKVPVEIFVAVMGASSYTYVEASANQKAPNFIQSCVNALHYFGGAPAAVVPDCLKSAVIRADRYESAINRMFADFGQHYQCTILPARPRKPKDKAKVEGSVRIVYQRIFAPLRDRVFHSLAQLNHAIAQELVRYNDHVMKGYGKSRKELFAELDKPALRPLAPRYEVKSYQYRKAGANYHVYLPDDMHYYSVPYVYRGLMVDVWYSASHVEIYHENRRISLHPRSRRKYGYTTTKDHMPPQHRYQDDWNAEKIRAYADAVGVNMRACVDIILGGVAHPEQGYRSCSGLLSLTRKYPRADVDRACAFAIDIESVTYSSVKNILISRVHESASGDAEHVPASPLPEHENIRGAEYYTKELLH